MIGLSKIVNLNALKGVLKIQNGVIIFIVGIILMYQEHLEIHVKFSLSFKKQVFP